MATVQPFLVGGKFDVARPDADRLTLLAGQRLVSQTTVKFGITR